jgi:hypothetical protein
MNRKVSTPATPGPPPLQLFGLVLQHDGRFTHEGAPIHNRLLREHFDRSVEYLPDEAKYIVRLKHFRGQIEIEEAGFFVRSIELATGEIAISDGSSETLDVSTLSASTIDGALLCRIKREWVSGGLLARFSHSAQADFLQAIELEGDHYAVSMGGKRTVCPEL